MLIHRPYIFALTSLLLLGSAAGGVAGPRLPRRSDPPTYEMRCRGTKSSVSLLFKTLNSRPDQTGETIVTDELAYTPSVRAAGPRSVGLHPGECSWIDRPVNSSEPYRIRFDTPANAQLKETLHGSAVDRSPTAAERYPDANTIPQYLKSEDHYWSFFVYNTGRGYLQATGHGVWKVPVLKVVPIDRDRRGVPALKKP
jgi:hypothetical protein